MARRRLCGNCPTCSRQNVSSGNHYAARNEGAACAARFPGFGARRFSGNPIHALIDDMWTWNICAELLEHEIVVAEIRPLAPSLEDVFVELTYKHQAAQEASRG